MENPWKKINGDDFYINDKSSIEEMNRQSQKEFEIRCQTGDPYFIDTELMPEPYMGNQNANIIFLFSNPGLTADKREHDDHANPELKKTLIKNLTHQNEEFPYYYLDPKFKKTAGGEWIRTRIKQVIELLTAEFKNKNEDEVIKAISNSIFTIQLHPFHSREYKTLKGNFFGHDYTLELFSNAVERVKKKDAIMICTRSYEEWNKVYKAKENTIENLDELPMDYFTKTKSPRSPHITKANFVNPKVFDRMIEIISKKL